MNKLAKVVLFAAAFMFVGGCASQKPVQAPVQTDVKAKVHHAKRHCGKMHRHCTDKLGASEESNTAK